jgi:soluble lytic murein transglycosylase-like protein
MRAALFACVAALLMGVSAPSAHSSPYKQANLYFEVRDHALQVVDRFTEQEIQTQAHQFEGKLLEVKGKISAVSRSESSGTLLIHQAEGAGTTVVAVPEEPLRANGSFLLVDASIRALCKVVRLDGSSTGSLELVIAVKEYEAAQVVRAREEKAKAEEQRRIAERRQQAVTPQMASRGVGGGAVRATPSRPAQPQAGAYTDGQLVAIYAKAVRYFNRRLSTQQSQRIARSIIHYSRKHGLDARLVMAVIACESNFNQNAVSPVGAMGLGQLMPGTAGDLGVRDPWSVEANLEGSTRLLKGHIRNMERNGEPTEEAIKLALACYNAGAGAVRKYKGIPPYRETQNYVKKITRLYKQFCGHG